MDFAIPFSKSFKYPHENIQWNINYKPKIKQLCDFIEQEGATHRINLVIDKFNQKQDIEIIKALLQKYPNFTIITCLSHYTPYLEQILTDNAIPHYYDQLVTNWDTFHGFLNLSVTDIFVAEELAFSIKKLSKLAKKNNKKLRLFCNVCQSSWSIESIKTFFIRPEDLKLYTPFVDTIEFFIPNSELSRINTLYEIYTKDQKWFGPLAEIILGYDGDQDSRYIIPYFGYKRLSCEKKCFKNDEKGCQLCDRIIELGHTLKNKHLYVTLEKNKKL